MNNKLKSLWLLCFVCFLPAISFSQAPLRSGVINYSVKVDASAFGENASQIEEMMSGSTLVVKFKGKNSIATTDMGMSKTISVTTEKNGTMMLMDVMGNKILMKSTKEQRIEKAKKSQVTITETEETRDIAGYSCKKAIVHYMTEKGEPVDLDVYYTTDIQTANDLNQGMFEGLKGFPLMFSLNQGGMKMEFMATSVKADDNISDDVFEVSTKGYKEMTPEEMQKMFSNMR